MNSEMCSNHENYLLFTSRFVRMEIILFWLNLVKVNINCIYKMSDSNENDKKKDKRGILRLDISKPRHSSGSVEFRNQPELIGQVCSICIYKHVDQFGILFLFSCQKRSYF